MKINIRDVKPGMMVSQPITIIGSSAPIINIGVELTDKLIESLGKFNIEEVDVILTEAQLLAYEADRGVETTVSRELSESSKRSINNFDTEKIIKNAQDMIKSILESEEFKYSLSDYKLDSDISSHSVRVATFSILLAKYYNDSLDKFIFDEATKEKCKIDFESIAVAAMLHDAGKVCKDKNFLDKLLQTDAKLDKFFPAVNKLNLSEYDERYSSIYSYLMLHDNSQLTPETKMMILLSNEDENCKGPLEPSENYINSRQNFVFGSKIIRLCNMYDETLDTVISNNEALENISAKLDLMAVNHVINEELEQLFINHIPLYSKGVKVQLSDGTYAVVEQSFRGRTNICKPVVRTIPNCGLIDLREELSLTVKGICSDTFSFYDIVTKQIETMERELSGEQKNRSY